jgi:cell fate (sporulation/competence/biofilm development) regulator YmcA (YheA/YmcA/DUF963 family)
MLATSALSATNQVVTQEELAQSVNEWIHENVDSAELKAEYSADISNIVSVLAEESGLSQQLAALQKQSGALDLKIKEKKNALTAIQQRIDLLKLKPAELAIVEKYNHSIMHEPDFWEWIQTKVTWFEVCKDLLISSLFFGLGIVWDKHAKT